MIAGVFCHLIEGVVLQHFLFMPNLYVRKELCYFYRVSFVSKFHFSFLLMTSFFSVCSLSTIMTNFCINYFFLAEIICHKNAISRIKSLSWPTVPERKVEASNRHGIRKRKLRDHISITNTSELYIK